MIAGEGVGGERGQANLIGGGLSFDNIRENRSTEVSIQKRKLAAVVIYFGKDGIGRLVGRADKDGNNKLLVEIKSGLVELESKIT